MDVAFNAIRRAIAALFGLALLALAGIIVLGLLRGDNWGEEGPYFLLLVLVSFGGALLLHALDD